MIKGSKATKTRDNPMETYNFISPITWIVLFHTMYKRNKKERVAFKIVGEME